MQIWKTVVSLHHDLQQHNFNHNQNFNLMTTTELHATIKSKLQPRTTEQLILDAKVARANKSNEAQRMIFALIMDVIAERMTESDFDCMYDEITA